MLKDFVKAVEPDEEELKKELKEAQEKLASYQMEIKSARLPVIVIFEGWGAAGKGSIIGRVINTITINGVFTAGGDTLFDFYSLAVTMWGIAIPLAVLGAFVFHWPVLLVYACTCLDEVGKIPWVMIRFRKYKWVRNLTR